MPPSTNISIPVTKLDVRGEGASLAAASDISDGDGYQWEKEGKEDH